MTIPELHKLILKIRYKPGFEIKLTGDTLTSMYHVYSCNLVILEPYCVRMRMTCIDADDLSLRKQSSLDNVWIVDPYLLEHMTEREMVRFLFNKIKELEIHETAEFFRVDGIKVFDPHKESETRVQNLDI